MPGLIAFVVVTVVHLFGQVTAPGGALTDITQVLIVPALAWVLLAGTPTPKSRLVRLVLAALVLSWLGDSLPRLAPDGSEIGFVLMVVPFLLAQVAFIAAFLPYASRSVVKDIPILTVYVLIWLVVLAILIIGGGNIIASVVYGSAVVAMAVLATGIDVVAGVGGALFVVSDALIGMHAFLQVDLPMHGFWVMLTYALAQALIVLAVARRDRLDVEAPLDEHRPDLHPQV